MLVHWDSQTRNSQERLCAGSARHAITPPRSLTYKSYGCFGLNAAMAGASIAMNYMHMLKCRKCHDRMMTHCFHVRPAVFVCTWHETS